MIEPEMRGLQSLTKNMNYWLEKGFRAQKWTEFSHVTTTVWIGLSRSISRPHYLWNFGATYTYFWTQCCNLLTKARDFHQNLLFTESKAKLCGYHLRKSLPFPLTVQIFHWCDIYFLSKFASRVLGKYVYFIYELLLQPPSVSSQQIKINDVIKCKNFVLKRLSLQLGRKVHFCTLLYSPRIMRRQLAFSFSKYIAIHSEPWEKYFTVLPQAKKKYCLKWVLRLYIRFQHSFKFTKKDVNTSAAFNCCCCWNSC